MTTYSKVLLSGGTNGKNIKVTATATPGTLIHTAVAGTASFDELWLEAFNSSGADVKLTVEYGGVAVPDDGVELTIPAEGGPIRIIAGWLLQNSLIVRAFAASANVIMVNGFVNRIV